MEHVTITAEAYARVREIMSEDPALSNSSLRIFVQGGGCSGMEYGFTFDEAVNDDDFTFEENGIRILIDSMSMTYLTGAKINYQDDLNGTRFVIDNPQAQTTCGCGSSFNPY